MPKSMERLVEPFSGMAAISIAVATEGGAKKYWINDLNAPLISVLESAAEAPHELCDGYKKTWDAQFTFEGGTLPTFTLSVIDTTAVTVV